jgi:hypothetical protein
MRTPYKLGNEQNILVSSSGDTFVLEDGYTRAMLDAEGRRNLPDITWYSYQTNQQFGTTTTGFSFQPRTIRLDITYQAINQQAYYDFVDRLTNFIRPNQNRQLTLRNVRKAAGAAPRVRDIDVRLTKAPLSDEFTRGARGFQDSIEFMADDPRYYNPTVQSFPIDNAISGGFGYPYGYPYGYGSGYVGESINYPGNVATHPIFAITGPFTDCVIYQITTGKEIRVLKALAAGKTLVINLSPGNISVADTDGIHFLDAVGASDLVGFYIAPADEAAGGVNQINFDAQGRTVATTCSIAYYERWANL